MPIFDVEKMPIISGDMVVYNNNGHVPYLSVYRGFKKVRTLNNDDKIIVEFLKKESEFISFISVISTLLSLRVTKADEIRKGLPGLCAFKLV